MSDDTSLENGTPEDNEVISGLREQLKIANKAVKTAGEDAIALVERGKVASSLMPKGLEGLSDIFEAEVNGELTKESAAEWLAGRGFAATPDALVEEADETAKELEEVTDLGSAVVAAGNLIPTDNVLTKLSEVVTEGRYQSLEDISKSVQTILEG